MKVRQMKLGPCTGMYNTQTNRMRMLVICSTEVISVRLIIVGLITTHDSEVIELQEKIVSNRMMGAKEWRERTGTSPLYNRVGRSRVCSVWGFKTDQSMRRSYAQPPLLVSKRIP